jgi:NAD(P)-dependent dehydrogenase (short-subunit alcohol dehydrogenase family)
VGRFDGKSVMIVGAAGGIGAATARRFADEGASLALFDISESVADVLDEVAGGNGIAETIDITSLASCADGAQAVLDRFGKIDVLAVIAGLIHDANPVTELPTDDWDRIMDVNLKGPFLLMKAVAPLIGEGGSIVTIGSWYGHSGHAFFSAYCASKAGLIVLTQTIAEELADAGVRVNCVCPGNINTDMHKAALQAEATKRNVTFDEMRDIEWAKIPLKKAGDPSVIADAVAFLASDDASYITGASIDVNGGVMFR